MTPEDPGTHGAPGPVPLRVAPAAGILAGSREAAMRRRPPGRPRRGADALATRVLTAGAGVAATLGLVVVLVPPEALVATAGSAGADSGSTDPGAHAALPQAAADATSPATPADVVETPAPTPSPVATKTVKPKATAKPTTKATARPGSVARAAATKRPATATAKPAPKPVASSGAGSTTAPVVQPTPAPATPRPAPVVTPPPPPPPTPVPTAPSGRP